MHKSQPLWQSRLLLMRIASLNNTGKKMFLSAERLRRLAACEESNPSAEFIKVDGVKADGEIKEDRNMCGKTNIPGEDAKQDGFCNQI